MRILSLALTAGLLLIATGCSMTSTAKGKDFNEMTDFEGSAVTHVNTTNVALHLLFQKPVMGNANLDATVSDFTKAAKATGAGKVRIVQSNKNTLWWVLPPLTFIIQTVVTSVAGDAK